MESINYLTDKAREGKARIIKDTLEVKNEF